MSVILKNFGNADERRSFPRGEFELVQIGGLTIGRATYQPGWKWSRDVGAATGAALLVGCGSLPAPLNLRLDRGDVAFVDHTGVALAMSTERDTLIKISYPDQVSWLTIAERFRAWIIGCVWLMVTIVFLLGLQRLLRHRRAASSD